MNLSGLGQTKTYQVRPDPKRTSSSELFGDSYTAMSMLGLVLQLNRFGKRFCFQQHTTIEACRAGEGVGYGLAGSFSFKY